MKINTARLVHKKERLLGDGGCFACGGPFPDKEHWYVRSKIREGQAVGDPIREGVESACSEACGRQIYNTCLTEISLVTGKKPANLSHSEQRRKELDER